MTQDHGHVGERLVAHHERLVDDHALETRQADGLLSDEFLDLLQGAEDDVGVAQGDALSPGESRHAAVGGGELDASAIAEEARVDVEHRVGKLLLVVREDDEVGGASKHTLLGFLRADGNGLGYVAGNLVDDLHDNGSGSAHSRELRHFNLDKEASAVQTLDHVELPGPKRADAEVGKGLLDSGFEGVLPGHGAVELGLVVHPGKGHREAMKQSGQHEP